MLALKTPITFNGQPGHIVGRSFQAQPRYDVMLDDGRVVADLPAETIQPVQPGLQRDQPMLGTQPPNGKRSRIGQKDISFDPSKR